MRRSCRAGPSSGARAELEAVAQVILKSERSRSNLPTAVGAALGHAATRLRDAPDCRARTIDIAGDGVHNDGFSPDLAYENFPLDDVTVNALIVGGAGGEDARLVAWFQAEVLHGPGAFSIFTRGYADYRAGHGGQAPAGTGAAGGGRDAGGRERGLTPPAQ